MIGAIAGDIIGSVYEHRPIKTKDFPLFHTRSAFTKGAEATALAIYLARMGHEKEVIRARIKMISGYDLDRTVDEIRPSYAFDIACQGTVPEAMVAFLDSTSYEDAVRNAVSLGGDSDTLACITGGIAEAYYKGIPNVIRAKLKKF